MKDKYLNEEHRIASSSVTRMQSGGIIPLKHAFMWIYGDKGAIVNSSVPYERYFIDGLEVNTKLISRGDKTSGCIFTGQEYTYDMYIQFRDRLCKNQFINAASCNKLASNCSYNASKC